ncbi:hypothetical protein [Methylobacterium aerolatum]|uniref:Cobalt transporter n=1 Tax=Methylobacterium aerolatum TaxID=418708 RepID=A0ABU0I434_9HYPH|nr:hypothetical protein [Methylobacterium aerolatum]MDQ0449377.1 hypothetical protein [Methylobacterium aerolatum]GJD36674.1 hypothetical protein FMGBMHLM_3597 [Methylobacterium aerolatum]
MDFHGNPHAHSLGHTVDSGDQLSSVVILGIAAVGGLVALVLTALIH